MKPIRTCLVCRKKFDKSELFRIVKLNQKIMIDENHKLQARGSYICKNKECHDKLKKQKFLNRAFKADVPENVYDEILKAIKLEG